MQEIEFPDVIVLHIPAAVITEKMVQLRYWAVEVLITYPVDKIQVLAGMQVIKMQSIGSRIC